MLKQHLFYTRSKLLEYQFIDILLLIDINIHKNNIYFMF